MVRQMDAEGFGNCWNQGEYEALCPKEISLANIARMRQEYARTVWFGSGE
jgi:succinate dehydrogenase / fumarate reductase iron-sulfur subunit